VQPLRPGRARRSPRPGDAPLIDVLYVAFNRFAYTVESFSALVENTDWRHVRTLFVHDDNSSDGTADWLVQATDRLAAAGAVQDVVYDGRRVGGPVATMNWYLDHPLARRDDADAFAKVDNDFVVCPGWLNELLAVLGRSPDLDILGTEPFLGDPTLPPLKERNAQTARHIGGKGVIRHRAFRYCRATPGGWNGYQGFTQWQHNHPEITKAWIVPDLPCFGLDQLPLEPWRTLANEYAEKGWQRKWPEYSTRATDYWSWWTPAADRPLKKPRRAARA
jgi:hypothetical protein